MRNPVTGLNGVELAVGAARTGSALPKRVRLWAYCVLGIVALLTVQAALPEHRFLPQVGGLSEWTVLAIFLAAMSCEFVDSALGMGYGTTLTPVLLLAGFEPQEIVPAILFSECLSGMLASLMHHRDGNVDLLRDRNARRTALLLGLLSIGGAVAATAVALSISKLWLTAIIGVIVLACGFAILATLRRQFRFRLGHLVVIGTVASFNKALSGGGYGPLVTSGQVVSGLPAKQAVGITSLAEGLTCFVGLTVYFIAAGGMQWALVIPLTTGALLSVPLATLTIRRLPEAAVRGAVGLTTCALGGLMFVKLFG